MQGRCFRPAVGLVYDLSGFFVFVMLVAQLFQFLQHPSLVGRPENQLRPGLHIDLLQKIQKIRQHRAHDKNHHGRNNRRKCQLSPGDRKPVCHQPLTRQDKNRRKNTGKYC